MSIELADRRITLQLQTGVIEPFRSEQADLFDLDLLTGQYIEQCREYFKPLDDFNFPGVLGDWFTTYPNLDLEAKPSDTVVKMYQRGVLNLIRNTQGVLDG